MQKQLPPGIWLFIRNLSAETTEEELSEFFYQQGIDMPVERISVKEFRTGATAMVSVHNNAVPELLATLFTWSATGKTLHGCEVKAEKPELVRRAS